jgi:thioesterase domain-containing protein/acyl carrier protein
MIAQFTGVNQNVVLVREDIAHSKRIVAYIIPENHGGIQRAELRNFLLQHLPEYMIPTSFVFMDAFPLTPNGKIDRKNLPIPDSSSEASFTEFVEPLEGTQKMLADIWSDLLNRGTISAHDDFFELGGHSLLAVSMMGRIENETNKRIPLATLFTHSKLSNLAKIIDNQQNANDWRSLVHIKPFGNLIPLFLIHGAGLNVMLYNTLINSLSIDQPVFGLQAKGLNGIDKPLETIEEIAEHYIKEIKTEYPVGPYAFAGFSLGGIIAFEIAKQLHQSGDEVAFVGMLDTIAYTSDQHLSNFQRRVRRIKFVVNQVFFNIGAFIHEPQEHKTKMFLWKLSSLKRKVKSLVYRLRASHAYATGDKDKLPTFLHNVHEINNRAGENYILKPTDVAIELFKAEHQTFYIEDKRTYGWDKYALKGIKIHLVPGEHSTLFWPPNDVQFAHTLQQRLNEVNTAYQLKIIKQNSI